LLSVTAGDGTPLVAPSALYSGITNYIIALYTRVGCRVIDQIACCRGCEEAIADSSWWRAGGYGCWHCIEINIQTCVIIMIRRSFEI